ncbi:hypothetical protein ACFL9U_17495 [Thermodesulfobacteriota bacterium]
MSYNTILVDTRDLASTCDIMYACVLAGIPSKSCGDRRGSILRD